MIKPTVSARADITHKVLRRTLNLAFQNAMLQAHTLKVSRSGVTMMCPLQLKKGSVCEIEFDIPLDGEMRKVIAVSKSRDCVCIGTQGFRTDLTFIKVNAQGVQAINALMDYAI